jgi:hypothetical protein
MLAVENDVIDKIVMDIKIGFRFVFLSRSMCMLMLVLDDLINITQLMIR